MHVGSTPSPNLRITMTQTTNSLYMQQQPRKRITLAPHDLHILVTFLGQWERTKELVPDPLARGEGEFKIEVWRWHRSNRFGEMPEITADTTDPNRLTLTFESEYDADDFYRKWSRHWKKILKLRVINSRLYNPASSTSPSRSRQIREVYAARQSTG